ncbi:hypothetical protein OIU34_17075 [Pararhizobium sp. BT-229]|uniref:hypothetical protein n=1 Tax=Pararhizobium sp. BT-229 TaxID=2986923 RepID=UPI0021F76488|nr:hypothetical protein [Pararhizobium sp. BT-229]MCV9963614.1 hypothetical protein [Pararhizobium sp. BT-229]
MRIEASYPLLFKARPPRATRDKDVFVSATGFYDIPEVRLSEMDVVFESRDAFAVERGFVRPKKMVKRPHHVRMMDGALYRPVCETFDKGAAAMLFGNAFPTHHQSTSEPGYECDISLSSDAIPEWRASHSPLSRPLYEQLHWRLSCEQVEKKRLGDLWPPFEYARKRLELNGTIPAGSTYARNYMSFDDVRRDLEQVDEAQMSYCHAAFRKHMERFVVADGQLWQRSRGPVYKVKVDYAISAVSVVMTHAPDWHDTNVNVRYFNLGDRDEAFECAEQMAQALNENEPLKYKVSDFTVPFEIDGAVPAFQSGEDELFRLACAVAAENRRVLYRNPNQGDRLAPERAAAVWRAFEEIRKTDYIFEEYGDPIDDIRANMDIWMLLGRRQSTYSFDEEFLSSLAFRRLAALEENRPISLSPIFASQPGL